MSDAPIPDVAFGGTAVEDVAVEDAANGAAHLSEADVAEFPGAAAVEAPVEWEDVDHWPEMEEVDAAIDRSFAFWGRPRRVTDGLDEMEPGPVLALVLSSLDDDDVSGYDRVVVLRARQRLVSHYQAQVYADMASVTDAIEKSGEEPQWAIEEAAAEISAALHLTRRTADFEVAFAHSLRERLPVVWQALVEGRIDPARARLLVNGTSHLPVETARAVIDELIIDAADLTTGQLRARLRRLCVDTAPDEAADRYHRAVDRRRVVVEASEEGTAHLLGLDLPPDRAAAAARRIDHLARQLSTTGEDRSMDQLRADVMLDLLEGTGRHTPGRGVVDIHVDLATLAQLNDAPGDLAGFGPVIADIARQVADRQHGSRWRFSVTDPGTGLLVDVGTTRRRPTAGQRRMVEARHASCVFPGCRAPATRSDLDHRIPWAEHQRTCTGGLAPLCRHHHVIRHRYGWTYRILPGGDVEWTSPLGHTYRTGRRPP